MYVQVQLRKGTVLWWLVHPSSLVRCLVTLLVGGLRLTGLSSMFNMHSNLELLPGFTGCAVVFMPVEYIWLGYSADARCSVCSM